jgi:hypothetical protein
LVTLNQKHQCAALSVEFVEKVDNDRNILKKIIMDDKN